MGCTSDNVGGMHFPAGCAKLYVSKQAVLKALREREAQLLTVQALEADIAKKHKALGVLDEQVHSSLTLPPPSKLGF